MRFNYFEKEKYKTIKDWELQTGIKILKLRGVFGKKSKAYSKKVTATVFRKILRKSIISVRTQKGLDFLYQ